jgi:AcrR family transcriptional regulator
LIDQALKTIDTEGAEALTLRGVGDALGVSRTALYRHFSDKQALLAAVASEGFRALRLALVEAWDGYGHGRPGLEAMGLAYIRFAVAHAAHYRVMFGRFVESAARDQDLIDTATCAFQALSDALIARQHDGAARRDDPVLQARFVWSVVHGVAMLILDGQLREGDEAGATLSRYAVERIQAAIAVA